MRQIRAPFLWLIKMYRHEISPWLPPRCRFEPTCSRYAEEALREWGVLKGLWLTVMRIGRCHPFHPGGMDPVPPSFHSSTAPADSLFNSLNKKVNR